jgi:hypothetical protein
VNAFAKLRRVLEYIDAVPELAFAKQTLKRVFVFLIIALSAVGLNAVVEVLKAKGVPVWITVALSIGEVVLVVADVLWFIRPLLLEIVDILKGMFRGAPVLLTLFASFALLVWALSSPSALGVFRSTVDHIVGVTVPLAKCCLTPRCTRLGAQRRPDCCSQPAGPSACGSTLDRPAAGRACMRTVGTPGTY